MRSKVKSSVAAPLRPLFQSAGPIGVTVFLSIFVSVAQTPFHHADTTVSPSVLKNDRSAFPSAVDYYSVVDRQATGQIEIELKLAVSA